MNAVHHTDIINKSLLYVEKLPPMPASIIEMRKVVANPNVNYTQLVPVLKKDPGLCADLLGMANSAIFGIRHTVKTVEEAVRYFGMASLVEFVASSFSEKVIRDFFKSVPQLHEYFDHSQKISKATKILTHNAGLSRTDQEMYAIAGLLHDIGRLILALITDSSARSLVHETRNSMQQQIEKETENLGINHCEIGWQVCKNWGFHDTLLQAVQRHHTPIKGDDFSKPGAYILLAHMVTVAGMPEEMFENLLPEPYMKKLSLTPALLYSTQQECIDEGIAS